MRIQAAESAICVLCGLTVELSGSQRQDARPGPVKMHRVPPARAWWPAVGAPLERGVRQHSTAVAVADYCAETASTALGLVRAIAKSVRAAPLGCFRPCSQP